jgi:hypothetical protein
VRADTDPPRRSRLLAVHLGWSAAVLIATGVVVGVELAAPCPPGGWLAFDCGPARDGVLAVLVVAAVLYVGLLSAVVWWWSRVARRPGVDPRGGRDWYLVAAAVGLVIAPLLAVVLLAPFGWLG